MVDQASSFWKILARSVTQSNSLYRDKIIGFVPTRRHKCTELLAKSHDDRVHRLGCLKARLLEAWIFDTFWMRLWRSVTVRLRDYIEQITCPDWLGKDPGSHIIGHGSCHPRRKHILHDLPQGLKTRIRPKNWVQDSMARVRLYAAKLRVANAIMLYITQCILGPNAHPVNLSSARCTL